MKIERLEPSKHVKGRVLAFLEDGSMLKITEQELLDFSLRPGDSLDQETLERLGQSAKTSQAKAQAAALLGRRAMSRRDLEKKLAEKGASSAEAGYAAEWLEAIGALDDGAYAQALVRHCADKGYGPGRYRSELARHGIDRELWDEAMAAAPEPEEVIAQFLQGRFRKRPPDERERRRAAESLARRGFSWEAIRSGLAPWEARED